MAYLHKTYMSPTFGSNGPMMSQTRDSARIEREMKFMSKVFCPVEERQNDRQAGQEDFSVNSPLINKFVHYDQYCQRANIYIANNNVVCVTGNRKLSELLP